MLNRQNLLSLLELVAENQARKYFHNSFNEERGDEYFHFFDKKSNDFIGVTTYDSDEKVSFCWLITRNNTCHKGTATYDITGLTSYYSPYLHEEEENGEWRGCYEDEREHSKYYDDFDLALRVVDYILLQPKVEKEL